jgi:pSer/pThr/pTyr-binding forkhead associated (FHA) protein
MPELILEIVEGDGAGRQTPLSGPIEIGRDASSSLALQDDQMSRHHARVSAQGDLALVEDLGSTNGTYVNGQKVEGPRAIRPGDQIRVGLTVIELRTAQDVQRQPSAVQPIPQVTQLSQGVLEPMPAAAAPADTPESAPAEATGSAPPSFALEETAPGFVPQEVADDEQARQDYGAVGRLVDTKVKHQAHLAVFGLLAAAGLAVLLAFGLK